MARATRSVRQTTQFPPVDVSAYLVDSSSRPRLGSWGVVAVVAGAILAIAVVAFESYLATLF
jgi:hypothetical protein